LQEIKAAKHVYFFLTIDDAASMRLQYVSSDCQHWKAAVNQIKEME